MLFSALSVNTPYNMDCERGAITQAHGSVQNTYKVYKNMNKIMFIHYCKATKIL